MATFDAETFLKVTGETGTGFFDAVGMSFGLPSCMLNIFDDLNVAALLPSNMLVDMDAVMQDAKDKADDATAWLFKWTMLNTGIMEWDSETGRFKFASSSKWFGMDNDDTQTNNDLGGVLAAFQWAASFGGQLYANYQGIANQVAGITDCLESFKSTQDFNAGNAANQRELMSDDQAAAFLDGKYSAMAAKVESNVAFSNKVGEAQKAIASILDARAKNPELEPKFLNTRELDRFLVGTSYDNQRVDYVDPGLESADEDDVFRLVYGPPRTSKGHYLLSKDGLYYDSQKGGLDPVYLSISATVEAGDLWKYDYDANIGGKGTSISLESLNEYTDSLFDPNLIDDSRVLQSAYDADHFLRTLIQQKNKHVYDLSATLAEFIADYTEDSSIVSNQKSLVLSEISSHNNKINRRKKQIEVAIKAPATFGRRREGRPLFASGHIPINDFSYLEQYNLVVDLEKQRRLTFKEGEVVGVVLPVRSSFVVAPPRPPSLGTQHLTVPEVGKGSIIYTPSGQGSGTMLSLDDLIESDGLFGIYNFLNSDVVTPSSTEYQLTNCATDDIYNNAKLVAPNNRNVFFSGLSIPYLEGIVKNKNSDPAAASGMGSFVRLPDSPEYRDLTYNRAGFTVEFWTHIPNIMDEKSGWLEQGLNGGVTTGVPSPSSLTKVVLACENVGSKPGASALDTVGNLRTQDNVKPDDGDQFVKGMLVGFTRDRKFNMPRSGSTNFINENLPASSLSFFVAPTQSLGPSSLSFINSDHCQNDEIFYGMKVDASSVVSNKKFGDVSSSFILVDLVVDPPNDEVRMYSDGVLMATSSLPSVFGVEPHRSPNLPGFYKKNSFEYSSTTVDAPTTLHEGPRLNPFYTPWIVGGGYTDGMYQNGNFMGGEYGGKTSGLRGFLGSLKFYSKALNSSEVTKNYEAQQGYFKNIQI